MLISDKDWLTIVQTFEEILDIEWVSEPPYPHYCPYCLSKRKTGLHDPTCIRSVLARYEPEGEKP